MNEEWALLLERIFMTEKNTIMERLFHTLDEKAKSLNEERAKFHRKLRISYGRYLYK